MVNKLNNTGEYLAIIFLDSAEMMVHYLLTCPISAVNFLLILRTSILHPNLKFILLCQSTCIFTRSSGRLIIAATKVFTGNVLWGGNDALNLIFGFSAFFRNFLAHVLVAERLIATLYVKSYEHSRRPWFSICWFIIVTIFAFANNFQTVSSTAVQLATWSVVFILALMETLIFLWIWRHNGHNFHEKLFAGHHSLSERYQIAENIRTGRQLVPTLFIHFFNISLGTLVNWSEYANIFGPVPPNLFYYALLEQLFYCTIAATSFLIELTMIIYHPYLRRNFMAIFNRIKAKLICQSRIRPSAKKEEEEMQQIVRMNIFGEKVDFGGNESDEYFFQLKRTWEICDKRK